MGRSDVRIIGVSKTHGPERIRGWLECGLVDFGENRQNEARDKFPLVQVADLPPNRQPIYHHIGPLQSSAARQVAGLFHWAHGVSSLHSLQSLQKALVHKGGSMQFLIQLDLTGETSKAGGIDEPGARELCAQADSERLRFRGFMTMGPSSGDHGATRRVFQRARKIRDELAPGGELSMGMSADWRIGVEEGATMIRVGSLLFGVRAGGAWKAP